MTRSTYGFCQGDFLALTLMWRILRRSWELEPHAAALGVTLASLRRLRCFVSPRWPGGLCFPMSRPSGKVVGVRVRASDGRKWSVRGSRNALFIAAGIERDPLFLTEGPTDCAALLDLGFSAIGRANANACGRDSIRVGTGRHLVIVADNDLAGIAGAEQLAHSIIGHALSVRLLTLLVGVKDARHWLTLGASPRDVQAALREARTFRIKIRGKGS